jgi:hypothetical protein
MTLTQAAELTSKVKKYVLIPVLVVMCIWLFAKMLNPSPELPEDYIIPNYLCGLLPELTIEGLDVTGDIDYRVETTSGGIPDLPEVVNVFKYDHPGQSLFALQEAQQTSELLKFDKTKFTRTSSTEYKWTDSLTKRTLIIEVSNQNIDMTTDFNDPSVNTHSGSLPSEEKAKEIALNYLQTASILTSDFAAGPKITHLIQIGSDGSLSKAPSISEADLIRVDFTRARDLITIDPELVEAAELGSTLQTELEEIDPSTITTDASGSKEVKRYPTHVFNNSPYFGNISVLVGGMKDTNTREYQVYGLEYRNWVIPVLPCGTYKLISAQEAVRRVQSGEAALTYLLEDRGDEIIPYEAKKVSSMTILEITLGYYDDWERQEYLQPVYVVSGDAQFDNGVFGKFYYYIPAIDYEGIPEDAGTQVPVQEDTTGQ